MSGKTGELAPAHLPEQKSCQLLLLPHHQGSISPEPTHLGGEDSFPALTPASLVTSSIWTEVLKDAGVDAPKAGGQGWGVDPKIGK